MTRPRHARGFALLIVLWSVVLLSAFATGITAAGRSDVQLARNVVSAARIQAAADGAVEAALFHLSDAPARAWPANNQPRSLTAGEFTITVTIADEARKVNPNYTPPDLLIALLTASGADPVTAAQIAAGIIEWHAPGQEAVAVARYRRAGMAFAPSGKPFRSVDELGLVIGMTPGLLDRLRPHISVLAEGPLNFAQADPVVRAAVLAQAGGEPTATLARPRIVAIRAEARGPNGSRFVRESVVELGTDRAGQPFRKLTWDAP